MALALHWLSACTASLHGAPGRFTTMLNPTEILAFAPWQDVPLVHMRTFRAAVIMSALPPKADMCGAITYVRFGPKADKRALTICVGLLIQIDASALTLFGLTF